jgi:hypothetical protein
MPARYSMVKTTKILTTFSSQPSQGQQRQSENRTSLKVKKVKKATTFTVAGIGSIPPPPTYLKSQPLCVTSLLVFLLYVWQVAVLPTLVS